MDIISAVKAARESGSMEIRRKSWEPANYSIMVYYLFRINPTVQPIKPQKPYYWNPRVDDILADDWEVVENSGDEIVCHFCGEKLDCSDNERG